MPMLRMKGDGTGTGGGAGASTDAARLVIDHPNLDAVISALALVFVDEINDVRTDPLTIKAAKTPTQIRDAIVAKLGS